VLLDKDGLAARLPAATGAAHVPRPPTQAEFDALVEEFWWESLYVAKHLRRDDLLPAKHSLDQVMKIDLLRRLIEWRIEIDRGWTWRPGDLGRGLKRHLDDRTWTELASTFTGAGTDENWAALFRTCHLFRRLARDVAARLDLRYPEALDAKVTARLEAIRRGQR
jgi:aminoglycoside 6-adenylyltransferase